MYDKKHDFIVAIKKIIPKKVVFYWNGCFDYFSMTDLKAFLLEFNLKKNFVGCW